MADVDLTGIDDDQKNAIIVEAAQPFLGPYRGLDQTPSGNATLLAVYQAGVAAATRAFADKIGATGSRKSIVGSIGEVFDHDFDAIVSSAGLLRDGGVFRAPQASTDQPEATVQPEVPQTAAVPVTPVVKPTAPVTPTTGGTPVPSADPTAPSPTT